MAVTQPCSVLKIRDSQDIDDRHGGIGVVVGDKLYLWGGTTDEEEVSSDYESTEEEDQANQKTYIHINLPRPDDPKFDVFDLQSLTWSSQATCGCVPDLGTGSTLSYHSGTQSLYLYGGWNDKHFSSDVFCVSMNTDIWQWEKIIIPDGHMKPSPRYLTGVLLHNDRLCNFAGVGLEIVKNQDKGAEYCGCIEGKRHYEFGWNNEYYEFDLIRKKWEAPMSNPNQKRRPPPMGGNMFVKFDRHRAVNFGGRTEKGKVNDIYIFDLDRKEFDGPIAPNVRPTERTFSTLCALVNPDEVGTAVYPGGPLRQQTLILLWGKKTPTLILDDCWLLNCEDLSWTKLELGEKGRHWHQACPYYPSSTEAQIVIYGGCTQERNKAGETEFIASKNLTILSFGVKSLQRLCTSAIVSMLSENGVSAEILDPDLVLPKYACVLQAK